MVPKLSIIVPVYNVELYLPACLDSILNQTLKEIEIICVNDGSPDNSAKILQEYAEKDARVIVITQENQGLGAARNTGIRHARGEYLGFVDSDDFIDPTMYEKLYNKARENDSDVVLTNLNLYYNDTGETASFRDWDFYEAMSKNGHFTAIEHPRILRFIGVWDRIYRRTMIDQYDLWNPEQRIYEDVIFTVKTSVFAKRISIVNEPLYYYRKNTGISIVDKEVVTDFYKFDFLKNLKESIAFLKEQGKYDLLKKEFLAFQQEGVIHHQNNMQTQASFLQFMQELSSVLDESDIAIMKDSAGSYSAKIYFSLLQKKRCRLAYIMFKVRKLYRADEFYWYFRFPGSKKYHKIKKPGY